jgi:hypothetical protein
MSTLPPTDPIREALDAAIGALQEAALLVGYLRRSVTSDLEDLGKVMSALSRASDAIRLTALRRGKK